MRESIGWTLATALITLGAGCAGSVVIEPPPLRQLVAPRPLDLGAAVQARALLTDSTYANAVARHFTMVTTENALKFGPLRPTREKFDFADADAIVAFAAAHGLRVRGHTLVWKRQFPDWLTEGRFTRDTLITILLDHIHTVVGRYRGRIAAWDVVNEGLKDSLRAGADVLRATIWRRTIGPEYIELAFRFAHEADPGALLFYNEARAEGRGPRSDAVYALMRDLRRRKVPVHGVGMEMHSALQRPPDTAAIAWNMRRLAALGLRVQITEMDVGVTEAGGTVEERLNAQAEVYRGVLATCLAVPACTALVTWGVSDRYTWRYPDTPLLLDTMFRPKPAFRAMADLLREAS